MPDLMPQQVQHLRHAHQHRDAPPVDQMQDVARTVARREEHVARNHRRDQRRHRLPKHVAQRQQIQESYGLERPHVFPVFRDAFVDGLQVRQNIAMRDGDAFGVARCSGSEQNFGEVVNRRRRPWRMRGA